MCQHWRPRTPGPSKIPLFFSRRGFISRSPPQGFRDTQIVVSHGTVGMLVVPCARVPIAPILSDPLVPPRIAHVLPCLFPCFGPLLGLCTRSRWGLAGQCDVVLCVTPLCVMLSRVLQANSGIVASAAMLAEFKELQLKKKYVSALFYSVCATHFTGVLRCSGPVSPESISAFRLDVPCPQTLLPRVGFQSLY
jgi:hypothetical protein